MPGLTINISWEYFLGIMAALILGAWYTNGRFTAIETSIQWLKDTINNLKTASDNASIPAYSSRSPVRLNATGESWLQESGLKEYIGTHKKDLTNICEEKRESNPYEVQEHIFKMFDTMVLEQTFENKLKKFAFEKGTTLNVLRRVGAIYFRDLCLSEFGMKQEDIDKNDPEKGSGAKK
ncbi:MAG: hypothetical protein ABSE18_03920 [Minisyncoccia bacterium]|jgi:hypothetical protein